MTARLLTQAQVLDGLAVSRATLARRVTESTRAGIAIPRVPVGPSTYRWRGLDQVERWLEELDRWRQSTSVRSGNSGG